MLQTLCLFPVRSLPLEDSTQRGIWVTEGIKLNKLAENQTLQKYHTRHFHKNICQSNSTQMTLMRLIFTE